MNKKSVTAAAAVAAIAAAALIGITWSVSAWSVDGFGDAAKTVQALGTLAAILAGGVFALYKLQVFRDFQPHLTITHEISHRRIGDSYVHLDVVSTLRNSSKTHVELRKADFVLSMISPVSDKEIEVLYAESIKDESYVSFQWEVHEDITIEWSHGELIVEPGESHQETHEFIVSGGVRSLMVYTYFYNSRHAGSPSSAEGWYATTVYDIME